MKKRLPILLAGALVFAVIAALAVGIGAQEPAKKIRIIYTDDLSGQLKSCG